MDFKLAFPVGTRVKIEDEEGFLTVGTVLGLSTHHSIGNYVQYDEFTMSRHGMYGMHGSNWGRENIKLLASSPYMELFL